MDLYQCVPFHVPQLRHVSSVSFCCSVTWKIPSVLLGQILRKEV
jgi:hypothetical protein